MISKKNENLISRYDDPELSTAERQQLTELLETEDKARGLEAQYRRLDAELETLPDGLDAVDFTGFRRRIRESIESAPVIQLPHRRLWTRWAPIAAAASVAIAFLSIWQFYKSGTGLQIEPTDGGGIVSRVNKVELATGSSQPVEPRVNRIQLAVVVESSFVMDLESDSVYDDGGVICFVGTESEGNRTSVPSASGFLGSLLKGST